MEDHEERGDRNWWRAQTVGLHTSNCKTFNLQPESLGFRHFDKWISHDLARLVDNCEWRIERVAKWDRPTQSYGASKSVVQNPSIDH